MVRAEAEATKRVREVSQWSFMARWGRGVGGGRKERSAPRRRLELCRFSRAPQSKNVELYLVGTSYYSSKQVAGGTSSTTPSHLDSERTPAIVLGALNYAELRGRFGRDLVLPGLFFAVLS